MSIALLNSIRCMDVEIHLGLDSATIDCSKNGSMGTMILVDRNHVAAEADCS